jgi:hypothetical protein
MRCTISGGRFDMEVEKMERESHVQFEALGTLSHNLQRPSKRLARVYLDMVVDIIQTHLLFWRLG